MINFKNDDERVVNEKRKVESQAFQILMVFLALSLVVQKFFFNAPFNQLSVELFGFVGAYLYVEFRNVTSGNYTFSKNTKSNKSIIKQGIITDIAATVVFVILSGIRDVSEIIFFFVGFTTASMGVSLVIIYFNKRKEAKIEEELNEDEDIVE